MWRATFFATFNRPELRMRYLDDDDTPIIFDRKPYTDWSKMKDLIDDKVNKIIKENSFDKIIVPSGTQYSSDNKNIILFALVYADKEITEESTINREYSKGIFENIVHFVAYNFSLKYEGLFCNVSWTWIDE
jgi:hypothetical protein